MIHKSVIISLTFLVIGSSATNYCNPELCNNGQLVHIGCNNNNTFYSTCNTPSLVTFSTTLQSLVLTTHNGYRNTVAGGLTQFTSAVRMPPLQWNQELALLAEYNIRQCGIQHDQCRNTDSFPYAGQNLAYMGTTASLTPTIIQSFIKKMQDNWYAELNSTTQAWIDSYPENTNGKIIGHFTAMIQDHATYVGCASATYKMVSGLNTFNTVSLACNYSFTNILEKSVYKKGATASECTTGRDPIYTSLCSSAEVISPSPF